MTLRINARKRLDRQYLRTRDLERYPSRLFNFRRTKWKAFKKILGTTAKYKFRKYEKHKNRYFKKKKFNFIKKVVLPKITDPFLYTPKAVRWNRRRKAFLMRLLRDKGIKYDYGDLVQRNKPLKSNEQEEILNTRFFSMHYRLGYLLIHNKYFFTFPEVRKNIQNKLIHVKKGSLDSTAEMPKGAIVEVQNKKLVMDFSNRPFLFNHKYLYHYDPEYNKKFTINFIPIKSSKKFNFLLQSVLTLSKKHKKFINKLKVLKTPLKDISKHYQIPYFRFLSKRKKKKFHSKLKKLRKKFKKKWKKLGEAVLINYFNYRFNYQKQKIRSDATNSLRLKKRRLKLKRKSKFLTLPYSLKRLSIKKRKNKKKMKTKKKEKAISNKKIDLKKLRKPSKLNEIEILLKKVIIKSAIKKLFSDRNFKYRFFQKKRQDKSKSANMKKTIKRHIFLPFMEKDRYAQAFAIIKHQRSLSRNDCILINPRKKRITKPSFLRNRQ